MKLTKKDIDIVISILKDNIDDLKALYIFGSNVDGTATAKSDIDIAYLSDARLSAVEKWNLSNKIAYILKKDIDLVDIFTANTILAYQIVSKGLRVYGSGYDVDNFETKVYSFYLRFSEERKSILDGIFEKKRSVYAK